MQAYFITLCAYQSQPFLGTLTDGRVELTEAGHIVNYCWKFIPDHDHRIKTNPRNLMPILFHGYFFL